MTQESEPSFVIAGTGSRSLTLANDDTRQKALSDLVALLGERGATRVYSGGAEGWDAALAQAAWLASIPYTLYLPNKGYIDYYWGKTSVTGRDRRKAAATMLERADEVVYVCASLYGDHPHKEGEKLHANFVRNHFLLCDANLGVVYDAASAGTRHGVGELKQHDVPYVIWTYENGFDTEN